MKTLRITRNIAALFIFAMALFSQTAVPFLHAGNSEWCLIKTGYNGCTYDANGGCKDAKCVAGQPCANSGCVQVKCKQTGC